MTVFPIFYKNTLTLYMHMNISYRYFINLEFVLIYYYVSCKENYGLKLVIYQKNLVNFVWLQKTYLSQGLFNFFLQNLLDQWWSSLMGRSELCATSCGLLTKNIWQCAKLDSLYIVLRYVFTYVDWASKSFLMKNEK